MRRTRRTLRHLWQISSLAPNSRAVMPTQRPEAYVVGEIKNALDIHSSPYFLTGSVFTFPNGATLTVRRIREIRGAAASFIVMDEKA